MRKFLAFTALLFLFGRTNAQQAVQLVQEGIGLHDKGDYEGAIKKYDAAIKIDKNFFDAYYEKGFSLYASGKQKECVDICKETIKMFKEHPSIGLVYIQYGNVMDDLGKAKQALEIYDEGISQSPGNYLLYFNKGLTLTKMNQMADALAQYQKALDLKPLHSSSNLYTGILIKESNKIPALLSILTFLAIEPNSKRAKDAYDMVRDIMEGHIKKDGNNTSISIDPSLLDKSKQGTENNFADVEMAFALLGAMDGDTKGMDAIAKTPADLLSFKLQMLINSLATSKANGKGFYWEHYVPFFIAMKDSDQVEVLCHLVMIQSKDEKNNEWITSNETKIDGFYEWMKNYRWK